jgi:hypothetical protein
MTGASLLAFATFAAFACGSLLVWESHAKDAKDAARQSRNRKRCNPLASRDLGNSSQLANNFDYSSAKERGDLWKNAIQFE